MARFDHRQLGPSLPRRLSLQADQQHAALSHTTAISFWGFWPRPFSAHYSNLAEVGRADTSTLSPTDGLLPTLLLSSA